MNLRPLPPDAATDTGRTRVWVVGAVLLLLAAAVVWIWQPWADPCETLRTHPIDRQRPYVIAVDTTADQPVRDLPSELTADIEAAAGRAADDEAQVPDVFHLAAIQGDTGAHFWVHTDYTADPEPPNARRARLEAERVADCVQEYAAQVRPRTENTNLLGALQEIGRSLPEQPPATVAVVSNGLANTPELDLRRLLAQGQEVDTVVDQLREDGTLPDLTGATVTFYGLGDTAPEHPELPVTYQRWVEELWVAVAEAAGAETVTVHNAPTETRGSYRDVPDDASFSPMRDSGPTQRPTEEPNEPVVLPDVLFDVGSCRLDTDATDPHLEPVLQRLTDEPAGRVEVVGHTATWGSVEYRKDLSLCRAEAVAQRLAELGADPERIETIGRGSSEPRVDDTDAEGRLIPEKAIHNRRVEIDFVRGNS
ncbi:OmpA family protein [Salinactinospora qingdaonensis]|uniref:OmpA family protein n=1 Tax=Salinactinospora qingdaonensis TaxID=702744 RepID=A0ABP7FFW2_9ACTN